MIWHKKILVLTMSLFLCLHRWSFSKSKELYQFMCIKFDCGTLLTIHKSVLMALLQIYVILYTLWPIFLCIYRDNINYLFMVIRVKENI